MPEKIFISHARADDGFVQRLRADLRAAGIETAADLTGSAKVLVVLTPASVVSASVRDELGTALDANRMVLPILQQECLIPFRLRQLPSVDFRTDYAVGLAELCRLLGGGHWEDEARALAANGEKIEAIKRVREAMGLGLKEAKDLVESWGRTPHVAPPPVVDGTWEPEARLLLQRGKKIEAIKRVREGTGLGLKDAKDLVESW